MDRGFVIQRTPTGLLDVLGMQSTGNTPHSLNAEVQATVDVSALFTIDRLQRALGGTVVIAAVGFQTAGIGPAPGELWLVDSLQISSGALAAATAFTLLPACLRQGLAANSQYFSDGVATANPATHGQAIMFPRPLILRPGDVLGVQVTSVTGAPGTQVFLAAFYVAVKI